MGRSLTLIHGVNRIDLATWVGAVERNKWTNWIPHVAQNQSPDLWVLLNALFTLNPLFHARIRFFCCWWKFGISVDQKKVFSPWTHCYSRTGLWDIFRMSTGDGLFFSALQPHTAVSTYAVPNDRELTADRQGKERRVQQQVQQRLAEKASSGKARGTAIPARDHFYMSG